MADEPKIFSRDEALVNIGTDAVSIGREYVERVALIIGPQSAAADALRRADEHGGPVRFWYSKSNGTLSVELLKETRH